jgi:hypothetical protein
MPGTDPYQHLRQRLANVAAGRVKRKSGRISAEPVTFKTDFAYEEETSWDPSQQCVITNQDTTHYLLDCGCRVASPSAIQQVCPLCATSLLLRLRGRQRFICKNHCMCIKCRRRLDRKHFRRRVYRALLAILLWPVGDLVDHYE